MEKHCFVVLVAEDDEHDLIALKRAWKKNHIINPLYIVRDGEECLDYLNCRGKYSKKETAPCPGILLLDIKMPKISGLEVLKSIRETGARMVETYKPSDFLEEIQEFFAEL